MSETEHARLQGGWFHDTIVACQSGVESLSIPSILVGNRHVSQDDYTDTGDIVDGMPVFRYSGTTNGTAKGAMGVLKGGLWSRAVVPIPDDGAAVFTPPEYNADHGVYMCSEYALTAEMFQGMPMLKQVDVVMIASWESVLLATRLDAVNMRF